MLWCATYGPPCIAINFDTISQILLKSRAVGRAGFWPQVSKLSGFIRARSVLPGREGGKGAVLPHQTDDKQKSTGAIRNIVVIKV